jgi:hypothetical protein
MTTPEPQPRPVYGPVSVSRLLLVVGCILFVIASLAAGGVITGLSDWAFGFGAFSAWVLSGAVP